MWRLAIIALLTTVAHGQVLSNPEQLQSTAIVQNTAPEMKNVRIVPRYDKLRRGHDEQIAIVPERSLISRPSCPVLPCPTVHIALDSLRLEPQEGFSFKYFKINKFKTESSTHLAFTKGGQVFLVQVKAAHDMLPGDYTIKGKLRQIRTENGMRFFEEVNVAIPVTVAERHATIKKNSWNYEVYRDNPFLLALEGIALVPVVVVYGTIMLITCHYDTC